MEMKQNYLSAPLIRRIVLLLGSTFTALSPAAGQATFEASDPGRRPRPVVDLIATYNAQRAQQAEGGGFWMQGGSLAAYGTLNRRFGVVAEASYVRARRSGSLPGIDLRSVTAGPRFTVNRGADGRWEFFLQALAGYAQGTHGEFPCGGSTCSHASGAAVDVSYGVDLNLGHGLLVRLGEVGWVHTELANGQASAQNSLLCASGVVIRLP